MNLVDTFSEFKAEKNIDRPTMARVLEDAGSLPPAFRRVVDERTFMKAKPRKNMAPGG